MDNKLKIFWNLDILVKMCRSKNDGPSLRVEEKEILENIESYNYEIEDIKSQNEDEIYDTSAEMADRNIEIITKKQLTKLRKTLKEKNKELDKLKENEKSLYEKASLLRENKLGNEKYLANMKDRLTTITDENTQKRYNSLISEATDKIVQITENLSTENQAYEELQNKIVELSNEIAAIEEDISRKKKLLSETQASLENKDNYVDTTKRDKNNKKIKDLQEKIEKATNRLEEIKKDPKYIETKIKDIINNKEDINQAKDYLSQLINIVINVPYINVPTDNNLEAELLRATRARDTFANEIDRKSYNILEADTPEKIRTDYLNERIDNWNKELEALNEKIGTIDSDKQYAYQIKDTLLSQMLANKENELLEFQKAYDETPDTSVGAKASIKVSIEDKQDDIVEAKKIINAFKNDEANDIAEATRLLNNDVVAINNRILKAQEEIEDIKNRLLSKKSGIIDISSKNKDKDTLKELAQIVIDIKHRRQFPDTPLDVIKRLEKLIGINLDDIVDYEKINSSSQIQAVDYDSMVHYNQYEMVDSLDEPVESVQPRGIRVIEETEITNPNEIVQQEEAPEEPQTVDEETSMEETGDYELEVPIEFNTENEQSTEEETPAEETSEEEVEEPQEEQSEETPAEETEEETEGGQETSVVTSDEEQPISLDEIDSQKVEETPIEESTNDEEQPITIDQALGNQPVEETPQEEVQEQPTEEEIQDNPFAQFEQPVVDQPTEEVTQESPAENTQESPTDISTEENPQEETPAVEEAPVELQSVPETGTSDEELAIDNMFNTSNNDTNSEKSDNIVSDELKEELNAYINSLNE